MFAYNWTGFYIGVNGGWGNSHKCWDYGGTTLVPLAFAAEGCHDASGGTVGGQIGYRWQASNFVFGVEAQGNWADFRGQNVSLVFPTITNRTKIDCVRLLHRPDRLFLEQRAGLREGRRRRRQRQV